MSSARRSPSAVAKRALLAGVALTVAWSPYAQAQTPAAPGAAPAATPARTPDGLEPGELYMEADEVVRDDEKRLTTAQGNVEVRYEGRTLRADRLIFQESDVEGQGVIRARGNVTIINDDGTVQYADEFVLDEDMRAGVALGFSTRLQQNVKLAGASAVRRNENIQELNRAIYTPCDICAADGKPKTPTWSIAADRVVQDKTRRIVYYRNARMRIFGVPLLYLPVFWHADPESPRASGFLAPKIGASDRRGLSYEQPYYWAISPYSDVILSPQLNTKVNPFLNVQGRKRFYSGDIEVRAGYTYEQDFDGRGQKFGEETHRSYLLASGAFRPADKWRWGFTAERASDDLIFDKYEVGDVYQSRGPYIADDRRLISQLYTVRQDRRSYFSTAAMSIQSLRPFDVDRTFPLIAPLVESHFEAGQVAGGRLRFHASAVALTRDQSPLNPALRLPGLDSRRVTGEADWRRTFTSRGGLRLEPFVNVRLDGYSINDITNGVAAQTRSETTSRALAVAGAFLTYPVHRRWRDASVVLEPIVQVAVSPDAKQIVLGTDPTGQPIYLNEDSATFEFDETTLFRANKFPGYDLYEDGARLNVAGRASILWDDGRRGSFLVGRSFRAEENDVFSLRSGLRQTASDWVVAADVQPIRGLSLFTRARLDSDNLDVHRLEAGANVATRRASGFVRYLTDDFAVDLTNPFQPTNLRRENLDVGGEVAIGRNWGVSAYGNRDITQEAWVIRDLGVFYRDECLRLDVIYRKEDTVIGRLGPRESITFRLTLATLAGPLYGN
ncbi:LPS-assembly protein LptD [Phenylobacterium sp.]|jgi:LPS-assembly protein|uniref:LPS-assembly protein LptD n=1 Tax=Phenylobacterium sp. TaxID=1871053 RepID=UPI002F945730